MESGRGLSRAAARCNWESPVLESDRCFKMDFTSGSTKDLLNEYHRLAADTLLGDG